MSQKNWWEEGSRLPRERWWWRTDSHIWYSLWEEGLVLPLLWGECPNDGLIRYMARMQEKPHLVLTLERVFPCRPSLRGYFYSGTRVSSKILKKHI